MDVGIGSKLGCYEILELLGRGGMGEVWRARDTSLDRDVALKLLPKSMAHDPERVARFEREAKLLASLNHPNIAHIHGLGESGESKFLILEYVAGDTLAERLTSGKVFVDEAFDICKQIACALEAAHEKGVVHRDLKPGNVMVAPDGSVKVLDFGLARAMIEDATDMSETTESPTITANFTKPGVVLGTAAYMSPEQARGRHLDKRTDIWSFGVILYECLTGSKLFQGETATDSMGAIMHREPDWSLLPTNTPPIIHLLMRRCLTKDRNRRLHDIADARVEIEEAITDPTSSSLNLAQLAVEDRDRAATRRSRWPGVVVAFVLGALVVAGVAYGLRSSPRLQPVRRFEIAQDLKPRNAVISPDGTRVAFVSEGDIYMRDLNSIENRLLWQSEDNVEVRQLFWSPDSQSLGVHADEILWRVAADSGQRIQIAEALAAWGCEWTDNGQIAFTDWRNGGIVQIAARGGTPHTLEEKLESEIHLHPGSMLPGGRGYLFVPHPLGEDALTLCLLTKDGERRELFRSDREINVPKYSNTGHILYAQADEPSGTWALPFSLKRLEVTGEPFLVLPKHRTFSVSETGDLVHTLQADGSDGATLVWVDRKGTVLDPIGPTLFGAQWPRLSPDGQRIALTAMGLDPNTREDGGDIWTIDVARGTATRLAAEDAFQSVATWSPDGKRIAYTSGQGMMGSSVYVRAADGSGERELFLKDAMIFSLADDWSMAAYMAGSFGDDIWIETLRLDAEASPQVFQKSSGWNTRPAIRPGGGLIAYLSGDMMDTSVPIYLRRFPDGDGRWQVSTMEAEFALWSKTGDRLYFVTKQGITETLMEVTVSLEGETVQLGEPTPLFSLTESRLNGRFGNFDVARDGERFLMLQDNAQPEDQGTAEGVVIIQNWYEEFRKRSD